MADSHSFFALTPDRVLDAVAAGGFEPTGHCQQLNSLENRVYDVRCEFEDTQRHVIVKFYRPGRWSRAQIEEEHAFLYELRANEIPVCAPLRFPGGDDTLRETEGILYAIWPRTGGRMADEFTDDQLEILGRLVARIHNVGAARPAEHRITLDPERYARAPLTYLEEHDLIPAHLGTRYRTAVESVAYVYENLSAGVPVHRIHGDCHIANLLHGNDGWFFLDFDDFLTGPAVQDVWMLVPARDVEGLRQRSVFLDAYRTFREFDDAWLALIEPLRALRYIHYTAWIARRRDDPAFTHAFPSWGSMEYWESEVVDLEEQVRLFDRDPVMNPGGPSQTAAEEELTNADFFWDWEGDQ